MKYSCTACDPIHDGSYLNFLCVHIVRVQGHMNRYWNWWWCWTEGLISGHCQLISFEINTTYDRMNWDDLTHTILYKSYMCPSVCLQILFSCISQGDHKLILIISEFAAILLHFAILLYCCFMLLVYSTIEACPCKTTLHRHARIQRQKTEN